MASSPDNMRTHQEMVLRTRTQYPIDWASSAAFLLVEGCVTLETGLSNGRRQVLSVHYPGDVILSQATPPLDNVAFCAMTTAKIQRLDEALLGSLLSRPSGGECSATYIVDVVARAKLHAIAATRLTGEERLVTLLVEMALFLGFSAPGGRVFEQPLSRQDMADYLGLNPDTLSRLMTRLRSLDLISLPTRSRMIVRDLARLSELSPLADALRRLHGATVRPAGA